MTIFQFKELFGDDGASKQAIHLACFEVCWKNKKIKN